MAYFLDVAFHFDVPKFIFQLRQLSLLTGHLWTPLSRKAPGSISLGFASPSVNQVGANPQFSCHFPDIASCIRELNSLFLEDCIVVFSLVCHVSPSISALRLN